MTSTWHAAPSEANWYCEVTFGKAGETDYNYGYSASLEEPGQDTVWDMVPSGYSILEVNISRLPDRTGDTI